MWKGIIIDVHASKLALDLFRARIDFGSDFQLDCALILHSIH